MKRKIKKIAKPVKKHPKDNVVLVNTKAMQAVNDFMQHCYWICNLDTADARAAYERCFGKEAPVYSLRTYLATTYHELFKEAPPITMDMNDLKILIGYELQHRGIKEYGLPIHFDKYKKSVYKNYEASKLLITNRKEAIDKFNPTMKGIMKSKEEILNTKETNMSTGKKKENKITITSVVLPLIAARKKSDEDIIKLVKKQFPKSAICDNHMAWYRGQIRKGRFVKYGFKPSDAPLLVKKSVKKKVAKKAIKKPIKKVIKKIKRKK